MSKSQKMKASFLSSIALMLIGTMLKIMHFEGTGVIFFLAVADTLFWTILAIIEVCSSQRIDFTEKMMWTISFIVFNMVAGFLYFLSGRQRVITNENSHKTPLAN